MNRLFLFILIIIANTALSQPELKFVHYTTNNGLANNDVLTICEDSLGFLWFGTKNGCSRFDGIEFKNYQNDENDSGSIGPGWVNKIICDSKNRLWFAISGHGSAFMQYNYELDKFISIDAYIKPQINNLNDQLFAIWYIGMDSKNRIWINSSGVGIGYYDDKNHELNSFDNRFKIVPGIRDIFEDSAKNIWLATQLGILIYNAKTNSFINYKHDPNNPQSISSDNCSCIFQDSDGQIWIGTYDGLNKLVSTSLETPIFQRFVHEANNPYSLSNNLVYDIVEDNNNNLLIATINGLCLMNKKSDKIYRYFSNDNDNESIGSNLIRSIFRDNQNNIWVATNAGIDKLQIKNFKSFSYSPNKNSVSHNKIQYMCEALNKEVWIATPKGIDVFNKKNEKFRFIAGITGNANGLYASPISLFSDDNKGMWIGTWNGGFSYFNYNSNKIINYIANSDTRFAENVFAIFKDSKNILWIGAHGEGAYAYNEKTGSYKLFSHSNNNKNSLSFDGIRVITEDADSNIWVGTQNGLNKLIDFKKGIFKQYLENLQINHITRSSDNSLWVGAHKGLYKYDKILDEFKRLDINNSSLGNILGILEDSSQNLWVSSNHGFARIALMSDSFTNITIYRAEEGLNIGDFVERSCIKLSDGTMIFGGTKGFCTFHPSMVKNDTIAPNVVLTKLEVNNKTVQVNQKINDQVILRNSISISKSLTLNYKNNVFAIDFAGIQYNLSQYTQYCYRLEGYDLPEQDWHYTDARNRRAEYMNLPYGNYIFKVKAANSYGVWSNKATELKITILPPWWKTLWFSASTIALLILFIILIIKRRTYNLQQQKKKLEKIVEQRTTELKEMNLILTDQKIQLEQQIRKTEEISQQLHEADQSKLRFFANISHEFRTPLSLIIAPLEKCLDIEYPDSWINIKNNYLHLMHKNAKRLLRLINQVIDFRKIEQGGKKLKISKSNIVEFVQEIVSAFSPYAEQKHISITAQSELPVINFWFDPDIMEKILFNLISNAIKYTPQGGNVSVQLSVNSEQSTVNSNQSYDSPLNADNCLLITVKDTGVGISKENLDKIFDRFYREETNENYTIEGAGIGLAYTKELIEIHKGLISVESESGKGTTFTLQFPLGKESFDEKTLTVDATPVNLKYTRSMIDTQETTQKNANEHSKDIDDQKKNKQTILLVEDNVDLRNFIKNELTPDYNIFEATNGKEGLELAIEAEPELIISDVMMPVMDGMELCKRVKNDENTSHIPVILLTAKEGEENTIEGLKTGADDYITKPFNINILKIKIHNLFLTRRKLQEKFGQSLDATPSELTASLIDQQFIQKAVDVVNEHMHNYEFDNDAFVDFMDYSRAMVYKKMKVLTGQSISEFIRSVRLKAAAQLFIKGHTNIKEVCYLVGYKHRSTFSTQFTKMFDKSPSDFIKEKLKNS